MKGSKQFFFEKKNQKTFIRWTQPFRKDARPANRSFLLLFFKKEVLASFLLLAAPTAQAQEGLFGNPSRFTEPTGEAVYRGVCTGCHMPQGQGASGAAAYPALAGNPRLAAAPYPILRVLRGKGAMPGFAGTLTNQQIADVVDYLRQNFGNAYPGLTTPNDVQAIR